METLSILMTQFTAGGIAVWLINKLKGWLGSIGIVQEMVSKIARIVAALVAAVAVVGINFAFDPTAGVLTVTGLTWSAMGVGLWEWCKQYVIQQGVFRINEAAKIAAGPPAVPK